MSDVMAGADGGRSPTRSSRRWAAALLIPLTAGCYTYTPISVDMAPPGENVRVYITRDDAPEFVAATGTTELVPEVSGRVESVEDGSLVLRVPIRQQNQIGLSAVDISQVVRVPTDEILALEQQSFSPVRTGFLIGGGAAAAAFILYIVIDAWSGDDSIEDPDPELLFGGRSRSLRPGLRIPIG